MNEKTSANASDSDMDDRWTVAGRVATAWFITIPASATVGASFYMLTTMFTS